MIKTLLFSKCIVSNTIEFQDSISTTGTLNNMSYSQFTATSADGSTIITSDVSGKGTLYIYNYENGNYIETKVTPTDLADGDYFGISLTISDDGKTIAVGAIYKDINGRTNCGCAYVFRYINNTWSYSTIVPSDSTAWDNFGRSVSISADGTRLVIGAHVKKISHTGAGKAYIYELENNVWVNKLAIPNPYSSTYSYFGHKVLMSKDGNLVAIGAPGLSRYTAQGFVAIYKRSNGIWSFSNKITKMSTFDSFGYDIAISLDNSKILIGAPNGITNNIVTGRAYLFNITDIPILEKEYYPETDISNIKAFGTSLAANSNFSKIAIGAPISTIDRLADMGCVFYYNGDGNTVLLPDTKVSPAYFGYGLSINSNNNILLAGAIYEQSNGNYGKIYKYSI